MPKEVPHNKIVIKMAGILLFIFAIWSLGSKTDKRAYFIHNKLFKTVGL